MESCKLDLKYLKQCRNDFNSVYEYLKKFVSQLNLDTVDGIRICYDSDLKYLLKSSKIEVTDQEFIKPVDKDENLNLIHFKENDFIGACILVQNNIKYRIKLIAVNNACCFTIGYDFTSIECLDENNENKEINKVFRYTLKDCVERNVFYGYFECVNISFQKMKELIQKAKEELENENVHWNCNDLADKLQKKGYDVNFVYKKYEEILYI